MPTGPLAPPTSLAFEEFTYLDGQNHLFGVLLSWVHTTDVRLQLYEVQLQATDDGAWVPVGQTATNSLDVRPITGGTYNFRVRTLGAGLAPSVWATYSGMTIIADPEPLDAVENLRVAGGGAVFSGRTCEMVWDAVSDVKLKDYVVEIRRADATLLRSDAVPASRTYYDYTWEMNWADTAGSPLRAFSVTVFARDVYDKLSDGTTFSVSNPAPSMAGLLPTVTNLAAGLRIDWSAITPADNDLESFEIYCSTTQADVQNLAAGALVRTASAVERNWIETNLTADAAHWVRIRPVDAFGPGTASELESGTPFKFGPEAVDVELQTSLEITDSIPHDAATLAALYDGAKASGGVLYTVTGLQWVQYAFPVANIIDRATVYTDGARPVIVATSENGSDWDYYAGTAAHEKDANGRLVAAASLAEATTNYYQMTADAEALLLPQGGVAKYCRLYFDVGSTVRLYELVFVREVLAEQVSADMITANTGQVGALATNLIQSGNLSTSTGILIDLLNEIIKVGGTGSPTLHWEGGVLTIRGLVEILPGSSGVANLTDAGALATMDAVDWENLDVPPRFGDTPGAAGLYLTPSYLGYWDGAVWKAYIRSNGTFLLDGNATNYIQWNGSTLTVRGLLNAADITAGYLNVDRIQAGSIVTGKLIGGAITTMVMAQSTGNVTVTYSTPATIISATINTVGGPVLIMAKTTLRGGSTSYYSHVDYTRITRNGSEITRGGPYLGLSNNATEGSHLPESFLWRDAVGEGTYTYRFQAMARSGGITVAPIAMRPSIVLIELKR